MTLTLAYGLGIPLDKGNNNYKRADDLGCRNKQRYCG